MSRRWPATARRAGPQPAPMDAMQSRYVDGITIRPLRNGDTATVAALFDRLGPQSRARRFGGAKPRLTERRARARSRASTATTTCSSRYVDGDPQPAGIARLVRDGAEAEVAFAGRRRAASAAASGRRSRASSRPTRAQRASRELRRDRLRRQPARCLAPHAGREVPRVTWHGRRARVRRRPRPTGVVAEIPRSPAE